LDDATLPNSTGVVMSAGSKLGSEAVCRQLSFEMRASCSIGETWGKLGEDDNTVRQPRCVNFDLVDEVLSSDERVQDVAHVHHSQNDLPHNTQVEETMSNGFHDDAERDGALEDTSPLGVRRWHQGVKTLHDEDEDAEDPQAREITGMQLTELRLKLQSFLSTHGVENRGPYTENMQSLDSKGNCLLEEAWQEKHFPEEEEEEEDEEDEVSSDRQLHEDADCQERLEELRRTLLDGLPDFSCRVSGIADTGDDLTDPPSFEMAVVASADQSTWPSLASSGQSPLNEGASLGSARIDKQFFEGLSPQSFATRLQGFSFGMSEAPAPSTYT